MAAARFSRRRDVILTLDGGFDGAERVRAILLHPEWGAYERGDLFSALKIEYSPRYTLGHRDILGALMALGVRRDVTGDIIAAGTPPAALVCLPEMGGYIARNLAKAGRVGVKVTEITLAELPGKAEDIAEKTDTVSSLRLDAVLCAAFNLSRGRAAEMIAAGLVSLDHATCLQPAKEVCGGAVISVRGMGRAKLLEIGGVSRKGRIFIKIGIYAR